LPLPLCVGLGKACELAQAEMAEEQARLLELRETLYQGICTRAPEAALNGDIENRIPGNLNLSFAGIDGEALLAGLKEIAVSSGSACTSASVEPSYVLKALGLGDALARSSLRIGLGRFTTDAEVDIAINEITKQVETLRQATAAE
jgi:cysteine desulfurase